jgi:hypothetical protein
MPSSTTDHILKCGLGSPGRDTLRARTKNHRGLRSHELFLVLFFSLIKKEHPFLPFTDYWKICIPIFPVSLWLILRR